MSRDKLDRHRCRRPRRCSAFLVYKQSRRTIRQLGSRPTTKDLPDDRTAGRHRQDQHHQRRQAGSERSDRSQTTGADKWMAAQAGQRAGQPADRQVDSLDNLKELKVDRGRHHQARRRRQEDNTSTRRTRPRRRLEGRRQEGRRPLRQERRARRDGRWSPASPTSAAAKGFSCYLYTQEPKDWRDKEIFKFDDAQRDVRSPSRTRTGRSRSRRATSGPARSTRSPFPASTRTRSRTPSRSTRPSTPTTSATASRRPTPGLDAPQATVTRPLKDNAGKYTLQVGKTATGTSHSLGEGRRRRDDRHRELERLGDWALADAAKFARRPRQTLAPPRRTRSSPRRRSRQRSLTEAHQLTRTAEESDDDGPLRPPRRRTTTARSTSSSTRRRASRPSSPSTTPASAPRSAAAASSSTTPTRRRSSTRCGSRAG